MLAVRNAVKTAEAGKNDETFASRIPKYAILTRLSAPAYEKLPTRLMEYEVRLRLGHLGLALEDFRSRHGKYLAALQELGLADAAITDPFSGKSFIYRPDGDSVLVYSVGADHTNDGGQSRKQRDIVWRVERADSAFQVDFFKYER